MKAILTAALFALALTACNAPAGPPLSGSQWWLKTMPGWEMTKAPQIPTVFFRSATEAGGRAGCNTWGGNYEQSGERLRFNALFMTEMACAYGMDAEQLYLDMLNKVRGASVSGESLTLTDEAGAALASFTRASTAVPPGGQ